jgi:hypothetical protein
MGGVEGAVEHGVGDSIEAAVRQVLGTTDEIARGVVHETGERPAVVPDSFDHLVDGLGVADVDGAGLDRAAAHLRQLFRGLAQHFLAPAADVDVRAQFEVFVRHLPAEAGAPAGDEYALTFEQSGSEHDLSFARGSARTSPGGMAAQTAQTAQTAQSYRIGTAPRSAEFGLAKWAEAYHNESVGFV